MILAGDVGGTKVTLALIEPAGAKLQVRRHQRFETERYAALAPIVREFLAASRDTPDLACFGIAAPLTGGTIEMPNRDWTFDRERLAEEIGVEQVSFVNDLEATALGIDLVEEKCLVELHPGQPRGVTAALIAAGTGLGMAILTEVDGRACALPSEGGHQDFAPRTEIEDELLDFLRRRFPGHVSVERAVSGPGVQAIYEFLLESGREKEPEWLAARLAASEDRSREISEVALSGGASICEAALEIFAGCYGAAAGNLALAALALRGVYLGGGITPEIQPILRSDAFREAFRGKGRLRDLLADVPVFVIAEPLTPLLGAARCATLVAEAGRREGARRQ